MSKPRTILRVIDANRVTCGRCEYLSTSASPDGQDNAWLCRMFGSEVNLGFKGAQTTPNRPKLCLQAQWSTPDQSHVVVPKDALMNLLRFASHMLAREASEGRQRPSEDYSAVWGGSREVFTYYHEELERQELEGLERQEG